MENYKAKFMCSYGGKIQRDTLDHTKLSYVGGHTKIVYVHRTTITFPAMLAKLATLCNAASASADVSFKYQLPGEDLDSLISVTDDDDLENMMIEYDQLHSASPKTARMRLFLFPNLPLDSAAASSEPEPDPAVRQLQLPPPPPPPSSSLSSRLVGPLSTHGKYDVFISFRGEDTRTNFTCHLHEALCRKRIKTFIDYELHKGDEISPSLFRAIEDSYVSVIVFSENYADSKWCLEELVRILECRKEYGQVVIPVFYEIDPSHVRKQNGSYKEAFEKKHMQNSMLDINKIQKWKDALAEAADLAGWDSHSRSYRDDTELIQRIVKDVLQKLIYHYPPNDFKGLVGIQEKSAPLESLLREARSVGIWGIGGIGKTTIARYIFDKYSHGFEGSCFLENIRERSGDHVQGLHDLRDQLYSVLLNEKVRQSSTAKSTFVECRIRRQSNFIVLDDVSSSKQLKYLVGELESYGPGSKIIITTRDKSVLQNRRVEKIHEVAGLDSPASLTLFSLNAFNEDSPEVGYKELSRKAVNYCKGVPLALVVLGSFLHSKTEAEWESALNKIEKIPNEEIQTVLRLSYDELDYEEQQIFLDIACFLKGELKENIVSLLDSCSLYPVIGMRSLLDKALITISNDSVGMHDLIQQMGWEIVRQESIENPEDRSRLWDLDDTCDVLKNNKGTGAIQGMKLDTYQIRQNLSLSVDTFKKMPNLKYLKFFISIREHGKLSGLQLPEELESFSEKLRHLEWHAYPLPSLPSNFCPEKLVTLQMPNGQFRRLWNKMQDLVNLKDVNLAGCQELVELPDLSKAKNLRNVDLFGCRSLSNIHPSILSCSTLERLDLTGCSKLETLESQTHFKSLWHLNVSGCKSLAKFSVSSEEVEVLDLMMGVKVLHPSIGRFSKARILHVDGHRLENLPKELSCLKSLETLSLHRCSRVSSKENLHLVFNGLQSLRELYFMDCHYLFELPDNINQLSSLQKLALDGSYVVRLPETIKHLSALETLSLKGCRRLQSLPELPSSIIRLEADNCTLLPIASSSLTNFRPKEDGRSDDSFHNCVNFHVQKHTDSFHQYLRDLAHRYELRRIKRRGGGGRRTMFADINFRIFYQDHRIPKWFTYQTKGASITFELDQPYDLCSSFVLCVVIAPCWPSPIKYGLILQYQCHLEDSDMNKYSTSKILLDDVPAERDFDHIYMSFDRGGIIEAIKAYKLKYGSQSESYKGNLKVTIEFYFYCCTFQWSQDHDWLIRECAVYPLVAPDSQLKQVELKLELGMENKRPRGILEMEHTEGGVGVGSSSDRGPLPSTKKFKELC
ncbi:protein SUPPRESSOR OF npr1-1, CONSTITUTIVE 1-like [Arachis ipaensis]|uniref:protein SUPPRESSOR OF npr1-1, CONSTITUTIVE 1-like n=1 Tax=Arachis ipaensis TaxID=130454 RepID=UPI0007AF57E9|nr:protein SUPPRESSOR OF npr1-1, CONSTITUTIVE 1-like [Arachis ipaensis]XP_020967127.1 protein SUPPRESSOR OF npr1-1, CONSTITUTIVE 1-like [Arachis ipaensis]XP_020967128.1 protein SUPPRESSOR OF npr1-1, CONSTITUTIVE 1-like [Arachis ipaensis]